MQASGVAAQAAVARSFDRSETVELGERIPYGAPVYNEVADFLIMEAHLLDEDRLQEWLGLMTEDIFYHMPVRQTKFRKDGRGFSPSADWYHENMDSLRFKVHRLTATENAYAEDPSSRTRRSIGNVILYETAAADELLAMSNLTLLRSRGASGEFDTISARRDDVLRRTAGGLRLVRRTILIDQAVLGTANLAIFL